MSDVALRVRDLGKQYRIGEIGRARYETLRDTLAILPRKILVYPWVLRSTFGI